MPKFYTVKEVAAIFKRSNWTIYRWIDAGKLSSIKVNDGHLIAQSEVNRFLKDCKNNLQNR